MSVAHTSTFSWPAQGRRYVRLVLIELRFSYAWLFMPLAVVAAIWFFNAWLWQPDRRWDLISSNIAQSFLLIGPAGAMWSAFVTGREGRSRLSDLSASMPVRSLPRHLLVIETPVVGCVVAYTLGALAMMVWYGRRVTWGGPDWALIGFGALVVLTCGVIGAAAGRVLLHRFVPIIVSGSIFLYFVMSWSMSNLGDSLRGWALLSYPRDGMRIWSPLMTYPPEISANEPPLAAGYLICASVIALALAALLGSHGRWKFAAPFALAAIVGFGGALPMTTITDEDRAMAIAALQEGSIPVEDPPLVCAGDVITTCLHQIDARDLDQASAAAEALLGPVQGLPGVPHTIEMRADLKSEPGILRSVMAGQEIDAMQLSHVVIPAIFDADGNGRLLSPAEQVIAAWLMQPVVPIDWPMQVAREAEDFAMLPPEERRAWLEANWEALRAGELTLEDLP